MKKRLPFCLTEEELAQNIARNFLLEYHYWLNQAKTEGSSVLIVLLVSFIAFQATNYHFWLLKVLILLVGAGAIWFFAYRFAETLQSYSFKRCWAVRKSRYFRLMVKLYQAEESDRTFTTAKLFLLANCYDILWYCAHEELGLLIPKETGRIIDRYYNGV